MTLAVFPEINAGPPDDDPEFRGRAPDLHPFQPALYPALSSYSIFRSA
jgi:hypothetical protein